MTPNLETPHINLPHGSPADWDEETLQRNWIEFLTSLANEQQNSIPIKRIRLQVEQNPIYQEIRHRWSNMDGGERINSWKSLLEATIQSAGDVLPTCVQCGECCRKGSPTLHAEDIELLQEGRISWQELFTLRQGEPVRSPLQEKLIFLPEERIKICEKEGSKSCVFLDESTDQCTIYSNRPLQCRAQACWDPKLAMQLAEQPYLSRHEIFKDIELLRDLISEHDHRCSFEKLSKAFELLEQNGGETIDEVLELLSYEDHFRRFLSEKLNIPEENLHLVFGRSFADLVPLFGFRVEQEPDGSRCLVLDRS